MTTSSYMPDVKVEIAWDGGFRIPMADWTWTDISEDVEFEDTLTINGGRRDERSTADANTLTLTLDNSSGDYTAARVTSANYPNVVLYKPIRVLATPVDGSESVRFTGYVTSWPVEWEDTEAYAKATVTASSRLARLGLNAQWRSLVEETILTDGPMAYYPLGEPTGAAVASDASGLGASPLTMTGDGVPVVFGEATGPGTDGLTAATFADGQYLGGPLASPLTGDFTLALFGLTATSPEAQILARVQGGGAVLVIAIDGTGALTSSLSTPPTEIALTGSTASAQQTYHVAVTYDGTTLKQYVDGALVDSDTGAIAAYSLDTLSVGEGLQGVAAHVAVWPSALSGTQIAAHAEAGSSAWAGETTDARFERYAAMAGIPTAEVNAEAGSTTVVHIDTTGQNVVDMLRVVETTEAGVAYDERDGTLTLHSRSHRYGATPVVTLDMSKHEVEADYSPRLDASTLVNDITVTGVVSAHLADEDSKEANGVATASLATASEDDDEPRNLAGWALLQFADPKPRVPSLSVNVTAQAAAFDAGSSTVSSADVLAVTVGDKITVANHPQQAALSITDYFVEGWTETYGPESVTVTWNVSPSSPDDSVLILDDPVYGVLDTYALAL